MQTVHEMVGGEPYEYLPLGEYVVRAPGVCGGRPTFKYTRVEVAGVLNRLGAGESVDEIVTGFNGKIPPEALQEAIDLAIERFSSSFPGLVAGERLME